METITLNNGVKIPQLGLGVFKVADDQTLIDSINAALAAGYRHFDTAKIYHNEDGVGTALANAGVKREALFVTSKLWDNVTTYDETKRAFEASLKRLKLDYLDMYLIHWPSAGYNEKWRAMEDLYHDGLIKAIGVSNFEANHLEKLLTTARVVPVVDQIETHPYFQQTALHALLHDLNIRHEAWGPLGQGKSDVLTNPVLAEIAAAHHKSTAQVILRWHIQRGEIVIPKSIHQNRIEQNIDVFDFKLTAADMLAIAGLNKDQRGSSDPQDEAWLAKSTTME
jgi:diketogulonate reductase-like aldo/keto reductase